MAKKRTLNLTFILLGIIMIVALYLRIDFVTSVEQKMPHDSVYYDKMVRQMLETGIYGYKSTESNARVSPGFPLFMAAVYKMADYQHNDPLPYIRYIQIGLSMLTLLLVYLITYRLGGRIPALIAAFVTAIYPSFVYANGAILTEVLATFFFILYLYLQMLAFDKKTWVFALLAGIALGLTVLTRPEFMLTIGAAHAFYWLWKRDFMRTLKLLLISVLGLGIVLSPWVIRNEVVLHQFVVAATQTNPFLAGTYPDKDYSKEFFDTKGMQEMEIAKERLRIGFTTEPVTFIKWYTVGKLIYLYGKWYSGAGSTPKFNVFPFGVTLAIHFAIVVAGIAALGSLAWRWRQPAALIAVLFVFLTIIRMAFVPEFRYNFSQMPLLIIMDSLLGVAVIRWIAGRRSSTNRVITEFQGGSHHE